METSKFTLIESYKKFSNGSPVGTPTIIKYFESKFEKEVGDIVNFEGSRFIVTYIGKDMVDVLGYKEMRLNHFRTVHGVRFTSVTKKF